jgi:hypothetical protein
VDWTNNKFLCLKLKKLLRRESVLLNTYTTTTKTTTSTTKKQSPAIAVRVFYLFLVDFHSRPVPDGLHDRIGTSLEGISLLAGLDHHGLV